MENISDKKSCVAGNSVTSTFNEKQIKWFLIFKIAENQIIRVPCQHRKAKTRGVGLIL